LPILDELRKHCDEVLAPRVWRGAVPLEVSVFQCADRRALPGVVGERFEPVQAGEGWEWGPKWSTAWFRVRGRVPGGAGEGGRWALRFDSGTEALLWIGGVPWHGFDLNRDAALLPANFGPEVDVYVEAACNHPLGVGWFFWDKPEVEARWSTPTPGRLTRCEMAVFDEVAWREWREAVFEVQRREELKKDGAAPVTSAKRCFAVGHAHLDTAWMWPIAETRRKAHRTFANAVRTMERFPDFKFLCSQPQQYAWVQESAPGLFSQIEQRVNEGRWQPMGAMWIEPDGNLPSGESFVRQLLYGTRYFESVFGERGRQRLAYLPDTFGFAASLPQIFRLAGLDTFITNKLWWNESNEFPHLYFRWRGIDGTEIVSHLTPGQEYNATNTPFELRRGMKIAERKDELGVGVWMQPFGFGDGGGGPTDWNVLNAELSREREGLPRVELAGAAEFVKALHARREEMVSEGRDFPVHEGELYLEKHRGTYTTQARVKRDNAWAEASLRVAEWLEVLTGCSRQGEPVRDFAQSGSVSASAEKLRRAWELTLLNQFHDILPGSSIGEVYRDAAADHDEVARLCAQIEQEAVTKIGAGLDTRWLEQPIAVFNPGSAARSQWVELEFEGEMRGTWVEAVPAMGVKVASSSSDGDKQHGLGQMTCNARNDGSHEVANEQISARIDAHGRVTALKTRGGECVVSEPLNQLALYDDHPKYWEAWDLDAEAMERPRVVETDARVEQITVGAGRPALRVTRSLGRQSRITQTYSILPGSARLDIDTEVEWREERTLLRALFPTNIVADEATYEIPFGHVRRSTKRETPEEKAMFEVPAHRWIDLSQPGRGLAVLNDCKYGHSCHGGVMGLSLLRSCKWPDPEADKGMHRFRYSLMPHGGDWRAAGVDREAELMVRGVWAVPVGLQQAGPTNEWEPREFVPFRVECSSGASVRVAAVKRAEEGGALVVRVVESSGRAGVCRVEWVSDCDVRSVDLLERSLGLSGFSHAGRETTFRMSAFQIVTLLVT